MEDRERIYIKRKKNIYAKRQEVESRDNLALSQYAGG